MQMLAPHFLGDKAKEIKSVHDLKTKFNHGDRKSFFIGQPTRKGGYGVPGTTFGEQFKGASGDVYKYKSELCTELAKIDQDKAERAYARKKRGERPGFKPASGPIHP